MGGELQAHFMQIHMHHLERHQVLSKPTVIPTINLFR